MPLGMGMGGFPGGFAGGMPGGFAGGFPAGALLGGGEVDISALAARLFQLSQPVEVPTAASFISSLPSATIGEEEIARKAQCSVCRAFRASAPPFSPPSPRPSSHPHAPARTHTHIRIPNSG